MQHGLHTSAAAVHQSRWAVELAGRIRRNFLLTAVATTSLTGLFFMVYFWVQQHQAYAPITMPRTELDLLIPFQPPALLAYVSLWIYVGIGPGIQRTIREFSVCGLWLCGLCVCGLGIFYFWPTQVPPEVLAATSFPGFATIHRLDETSNACPSMHVAVAIFTVVSVDTALRSMRAALYVRMLNVVWFLLIVYSTLAIKQHVVLDVLAGAVLGMIFALLSLRWRSGYSRDPGWAALSQPS